MRVFQITLNLTFSLVKVCKLLIKRQLNFSFPGAKGNLITINFVSLNNYFGINNYSFSSLNLKKSVIDKLNMITSM